MKKLTINELKTISKNNIKEHLIEYDFTYYYIIEYLSKILLKYTNNGTLNLMSYFEDVFLKNVDIWGFTMIYIAFYEKLYISYDKLNKYQIDFLLKIKYIIIHFLYETPINPINVSSLVKELTSLNTIIEKFNINQSPRKLNYFLNINENVGGFIKSKKKRQNKQIQTRKRR